MAILNHQRELIESDKLIFNINNPRLFGESDNDLEEDVEIIRVLSRGSDIAELVISILKNTFVDFEPMVVIPAEGNTYRVLEGNRRLAAIKLLKDPSLANELSQDLGYKIDQPVPPKVLESLREASVIIVEDEADAQAYIGFKHINGAHKWTSFAKAKFVTDWYKQDMPIDDIAKKVGDKNLTVKNLIAGMLVLEQAQNEQLFSINDRTKRGVFGFSHLYTALNRKEYQAFLGIESKWMDTPNENPIKKESLKNLEIALKYMYGSKPDGIDSVIRSQNPNLKQLGIVLSNPVARAKLIETNDLSTALEETEEKSALFERSLISAHTHLQKAFGNVTDYGGSQELFTVAEDMSKKITAMISIMKGTIDAE